ncbi:uncharacterized protein DS421_13g393720 [Arachis hypogaea]|nr:uncharacterized protein DS421_13g393720 [Arachis hypogaea]
MASKNQGEKKYNQTKDLKCATHLLSEKFGNMTEEKKAIVRDLGFGGLMHIPPLRMHHKLLKELANSFKLGKNTLETGYGSFRVLPSTIGTALVLNASGDLFPTKVSYKELSEENKQIFRRFQRKTLKSLTDEMMSIGVGNEQDRLMFKRVFILYIQMAFLLPATINKISPVHLAPIFKMDKIKEGNWGAHVLNFIIKGITNYNLKKKKSIDGCLFALMIVYFHLSTKKEKKGEERTAQPWIANWNKEQLVERMRAEMDEHMLRNCKDGRNKEENETNEEKRKKQKNQKTKKRKASSSSSEHETTESEVYSTFEPETKEDSEEPTRKQPTRTAKKIQKRKKIQEDFDSQSESNDESEESSPVEKQKTKKKTQRTPQKTQSKKKKVSVEDSSLEKAQSYHGSEIGTEKLEEFLRKNNEKSAAQGEKEADLRSTEGHYVSSETIPEVNLGSDDPLSQEHTDQSSVNKPAESMLSLVEESPSDQAEENMMVLREETQSQTEALSINPAPKDAAALMMMARTASYIPKKGPMPSFSLGLTDSSQEEAATQEGAAMQDGERAKTPEMPRLLE